MYLHLYSYREQLYIHLPGDVFVCALVCAFSRSFRLSPQHYVEKLRGFWGLRGAQVITQVIWFMVHARAVLKYICEIRRLIDAAKHI